MLLNAVLPWLMAAFALALLLNAWALFKGPSLPERILALDLLYLNALALFVLLGLALGTAWYAEVAVLISLLGFVSTVALCKFILRGAVV